jgi:hypothetical protein
MAQSISDMSVEWADGTLKNGIKLNVTDTSSNASSLLMDLGTGGGSFASKFKVDKAGNVTTAGFAVLSVPGGQITNNLFYADNSQVIVRYNATLGFGDGLSAPDVVVRRDAANTLAQRNGANAQAFRIYNTFTDASNHERGKIEWSSNVLRIGTEKAGSGTARALELQTDGTTRLTIGATGTAVFSLRVNAPELFIDKGASGRVIFIPTADGSFQMLNNNGNDFGRLQFGGTTSSFPALKRSGTSLIVRLADDTANAPLESASVKTDAPAGGTSGTWKLGVAATVSPTSPDRTIEVDIGGTIYYIAAKTTND